MESICSVEDLSVAEYDNIYCEHINMEIHRGTITGLFSNDNAAPFLLQAIGKLYEPSSGTVSYDDSYIDPKLGLSTRVQYVPDDIIYYPNLNARQFFTGASALLSEDTVKEQARLCSLFGIDIEETLTHMSPEHNRLVSYIAAIAMKPELLLIDCPSDMIGSRNYVTLIRELISLHKAGTAIVMAAHSYSSINLPCDDYYFLRDDKCSHYTRKTLPRQSKVVTVVGGSIHPADADNCTLLFSGKKRTRFVCHGYNRDQLIIMLYRTGCRDFFVDELTMEEEIFEDYSRWMP